MTYRTPQKYFFRLHHIRPRFKTDFESVLFFMSEAICRIGELPTKEFDQQFLEEIRNYPGNAGSTKKTLQNWRTEISSLFALVEEKDGRRFPSRLTKQLAKNGDLVEFFREFLFSFQYPGGHLKPQSNINIIKQGIQYNPCKIILAIFIYGMKKERNLEFQNRRRLTLFNTTLG